jgi:DNA polymerase III subunit epsilon
MINTYVSLDLETTGLNPKQDKIIEIGAVKVVNGEIVDTYTTLVKPGRKLDDVVIQLTGIDDSMLKGDLVKEPNVAIPELLDFLGNYILLGHSILFDFSFVKRYAVNQRMTYEAEAIDTLKIARKYLQELPSRSLPALCEYYHITQKAHRALEDAVATSHLYQKLLEKFYGEEQADDAEKTFTPQKLIYQVKRESPITKSQREYLERLINYHNIKPDFEIDRLTRNEASRKTDHIILQYGTMPKTE